MHALISFVFLILGPPAFAATATQADLDALDRLECFAENPLIDSTNDFVLMAIIPDAHARFSRTGDGASVRLTRSLRGRFVRDDLSGGDSENENVVDRDPSNVLRVTVRSRGRGVFSSRDERRRRFLSEVERLRERFPNAKLTCVYDVVEYARVRACVAALGG